MGRSALRGPVRKTMKERPLLEGCQCQYYIIILCCVSDAKAAEVSIVTRGRRSSWLLFGQSGRGLVSAPDTTRLVLCLNSVVRS